MKYLTVKTSVQFDQYDDDADSTEYAIKALNEINTRLQSTFSDIDPIIFTHQITAADITIEEVDTDEEQE